jgi:hypothetical protein
VHGAKRAELTGAGTLILGTEFFLKLRGDARVEDAYVYQAVRRYRAAAPCGPETDELLARLLRRVRRLAASGTVPFVSNTSRRMSARLVLNGMTD